MTAPSPDVPGQGEAGAGGEVASRDALALVIYDHIWGGGEYPGDEAECCADAVLASDWLAAHDASVVAAARADAEGRLGEVLLGRAEVAARVLYDEMDDGYGTGWDETYPHVRRSYREMARAALRAVLDAAGPREGE